MALHTKTPHSKTIVSEVMSAKGYVRRQVWTNPVALDADRLLNDQSLNASTVTSFLAQPDFPRKLTLVASGATSANVTINGTNIRDMAISETIALNGTNTVTTTKAFKTVTSVVLPNVGGVTIDLGINDALGLDRCMSGNDVLYTNVDGVREGTAASVTFDNDEVEKNTIDPNTALDGARDISIVYVSTELTDKGHTTA
jgi:hypothetical protein